MGVRAFCSLFSVNEKENANLLDLEKTEFTTSYYPLEYYFDKISGDTKALFESIQAKALFEPIQAYVKKKRNGDSELSKEPDIFSFSRKKLMRHYYTGLLERTNGNQRQSADMAKMNYQTFRSACKRYGIKNVVR